MSSVFSAVPGLRPGAVAVLAAGLTLAGLPAAAHATGTGQASAATADVRLDVSLLNKSVHVPVDVSLNKVHAPRSSGGTLLSARIDGVAQGAPVTLVKADVGNSRATVDARGARASVQLVDADVHLPGLPLTTLLGLEAVSSQVDCPVHGQPTARVNVLGTLRVLGHKVTLSASGPTRVKVPGVGEVSLELSRKAVTSTTAAATALQLDVAVNPLDLNVAKVTGRVALASVSCVKPGASGSTGGTTGGSTTGGGTTGGSTTGGGTTGGSTTGGSTTGGGTTGGSTAGGSTAGGASTGGGTAGGGTAGGTVPSATPSTSPSQSASPTGGPAASGGSAGAQSTGADLAETGSTVSPLMFGGAALLVAGGAGAMVAVRRRKGAAGRH